jgi:ParB family chromosome partitioning protein
MLRDALIENIHRVNLNPLEEAAAYAQLMNDFGITQNELSKQIARSRSQIANTLRLLNLPVSTQKKVAAKVISAGHARALLSFEDSNVIDEVAERIIKEALSVRDVEELAVLYKQNANNLPKHEKLPGDTALGAVHDSMDSENRLTQYSDKISDILETEALVTLQKVGGKITIRFSDIADLNRIVEMITRIAEHSDGDEF